MPSFAAQFHKEATEQLAARPEFWPLSLEVFKSAGLRASGRSMNFVTRRKDYHELLLQQVGEDDVKLNEEQQVIRLSWSERAQLEKIREDIRFFLAELHALDIMEWRSVEPLKHVYETEEELRNRAVAAILQTLYLATGSLSEPQDSYHLEFSFPRILACTAYHEFLNGLGFNFKVLDRTSSRVLYLKGGEELGDFLLRSGCVRAYLEFENLRVDKDMKNRVNRVVNCDSANATRLANASARQDFDIRLIEERIGLKKLPKKLYEAATVRLAHPGLSLEELGQLMDPPIGKSGMNHRMKKLREIAEDLRE